MGVSKVGQTVLARSMESQICHQPAGSIGGGYRKETMASAHLDGRHFSYSLYASGAFHALTLVLELRVRVRICESVFGFLKRNCLGLQKFFPPT